MFFLYWSFFPVPDTAQIKIGKPLSSTSVRVEWTVVPSASRYYLLLYQATGPVVNVTSTDNSAVVRNLEPSTNYDCYVFTANKAGMGSKSKRRTITTCELLAFMYMWSLEGEDVDNLKTCLCMLTRRYSKSDLCSPNVVANNDKENNVNLVIWLSYYFIVLFLCLFLSYLFQFALILNVALTHSFIISTLWLIFCENTNVKPHKQYRFNTSCTMINGKRVELFHEIKLIWMIPKTVSVKTSRM